MVSSQERGYDAGKRIKGIKRHVIVDTLGSILAVVIQSGGYRGKLIEKIKQAFNIEIKIVKTKDLPIFKVLPKRWILERTFAWMETNRRNTKNYERLSLSGIAIIRIAAIRLMLARF